MLNVIGNFRKLIMINSVMLSKKIQYPYPCPNEIQNSIFQAIHLRMYKNK